MSADFCESWSPSDINAIVWDWNGTLLNDVDICVQSMNMLLQDYKLPLLSRDRYTSVFNFPAIEYYRRCGFKIHTDSEFEELSVRFHRNYMMKLHEAAVSKQLVKLAAVAAATGVSNFILSAMEQELLERSLRHFGLVRLFKGAYGLDNMQAKSKVLAGKRLLQREKVNTARAVMIGDTVHDYHVAKELGLPCILVTFGHQHVELLFKTGAPLFEQPEALADFMGINSDS